MRKYDQGSLVRVTVSADEAHRFAYRWPCSGIKWGDKFSFTFEKSNGDLVDMHGDKERHDGSAILAISEDASKYAGLR